MQGNGSARRAMFMSALAATSLITVGSGVQARATTPCVWTSYHLPVGSNETQACARGKAMDSESSGVSIAHRRRAGDYFVEVGAEVSFPD